MAIVLDKKELRALTLISNNPAHEVDKHPITTVKTLASLGLVQYSTFDKITARGRVWYQREITITDKGKKFLEECK